MNRARRATLNFAVKQIRDIRLMTGTAPESLAPVVAKSLRQFADLPPITGAELLAAYEADRQRRRERRTQREQAAERRCTYRDPVTKSRCVIDRWHVTDHAF